MSEAKFSILLHTSDYRGDHSTDIAMAFNVRPGETVEQLAERLLIDKVHGAKFNERIEIRLIQP